MEIGRDVSTVGLFNVFRKGMENSGFKRVREKYPWLNLEGLNKLGKILKESP